jgi:hypothetical protein
MTDLFKNLRSSEQVAEETGLTVRRIQQLAPDLINKGLAQKFSRVTIFHKTAIPFIRDLPETRGRKKIR